MNTLTACQLHHDFQLPSDPDVSPAQLVADAINSYANSGKYQELMGKAADIYVEAEADAGDDEPRVRTSLNILTDGGQSVNDAKQFLCEALEDIVKRVRASR